jgi:short-subunit dehydrogenase
MDNYHFSGKTVLVTGGSMGIGACFAHELHRRGARLVLVARSQGKLERLAAELPGTLLIVEDLTQPGAAQRVHQATRAMQLSVDVLINNAGFAEFGRFGERELASQRDQIALNVAALVELTHLFLPELLQNRGGVINVASTAAFQPVAFMAVYAASKAFVLSFSEALWAEYRAQGLRVLALCPGATDTPFFERAGEAAAFGKKARPEQVVELGLAAFQRNRPSVVHGAGNWFTAQLGRVFTRAFVASVTASLMRPRKPALPPDSTAARAR